MEAIIEQSKIITHGGLTLMRHELIKRGTDTTIDYCMGERAGQAIFSKSNVYIMHCFSLLSSANNPQRIHSIRLLKDDLEKIHGLKVMSHDVICDVMGKDATKLKVHETVDRNAKARIRFTDYNDNMKLSNMVTQVTVLMNPHLRIGSHTMHVDATNLPSEAQGAMVKTANRTGGKILNGKKGYSALACMVDGKVFHLELRNGDAGPNFRLKKVTRKALLLAHSAGININRIVMDAAGETNEVMNLIEDLKMQFVVRHKCVKDYRFMQELKNCNNWRPIELETNKTFWNGEIGYFDHTMHRTKKVDGRTHRIVALRVPTDELINKIASEEDRKIRERITSNLKKAENSGLLNVGEKKYNEEIRKTIDGYEYVFFTTNDYVTAPEDIVIEYNKRGAAERVFSYLKGSFGWGVPTFRTIPKNTVYLLACALASNIYQGYLLHLVRKGIPKIRRNMQSSEFYSYFIINPCYRNKRGYVFFNSKIPVYLILPLLRPMQRARDKINSALLTSILKNNRQ